MENASIVNDCGIHGVHKNKRRIAKPYKVEFRRNKKTYYAGYYSTLEEASVAKMQCEQRLSAWHG
jgi:hypothetical protein